jgi:hypothetical protein
MRADSPAVRIFPTRNGCVRYILYISSFGSKRYCWRDESCFLRSKAGAETVCDLPVFFDELSEANDAMRALLARHDDNEEALSLGASAVS